MLHSVQKEDGLYFNIIEISRKNADFWDGLANKNENDQTITGTYALQAALESYASRYTFLQDSPYHAPSKDKKLWVAFISSEAIEESTLDEQSNAIEMMMSVATSKNASFSTHMGIFRATETFSGTKHSKISTELHAFAASFVRNAAENDETEKKYLVFNPAFNMRQILYKALQAIGKKDLFFGYTNTESTKTIEEAQASLEEAKHIEECDDDDERSYPKAQLELSLALQSEAISKGEMSFPPIQIENLDGKILPPDTEFAYTEQGLGFKGEDEELHPFVLKILDVKHTSSDPEFSWFFSHPNQIISSNALETLCTVSLEDVCSLGSSAFGSEFVE